MEESIKNKKEKLERGVDELLEKCKPSQRVDGKYHTWKFDGDDPYMICHWCGQRRDAISNRIIK